MTDQQIIDLFDSTNITLAELSRKSGRSVADLRKILMNGGIFGTGSQKEVNE